MVSRESLLIAALNLLFFVSTAFAQTPLIKVDQGRASLLLVSESPHLYRLVTGSPDIKLINAFLVENPNRLVIDLSGFDIKQAKSLKPTSSAEISGLRVGVHSDKVRLVLDISGKVIPTFKADSAAGRVSVSIDFSGEKKEEESTAEEAGKIEQVAPVEIPATVIPPTHAAPVVEVHPTASAPEPTHVAEATKEIVPTSAPLPTLTPVPTETPKPAPTLIPLTPTRTPRASIIPVTTKAPIPVGTQMVVSTQAPIITANGGLIESPAKEPALPASTPTTLAQELTGIFFEHVNVEQTPILRFALTKRGEFRFAKIDDHTYEITLSGYTISQPFLELPQFPPQDFVGITYVRASSKQAGVKIAVGVDRGVKIAPIAKDTDIVIQLQLG